MLVKILNRDNDANGNQLFDIPFTRTKDSRVVFFVAPAGTFFRLLALFILANYVCHWLLITIVPLIRCVNSLFTAHQILQPTIMEWLNVSLTARIACHEIAAHKLVVIPVDVTVAYELVLNSCN